MAAEEYDNSDVSMESRVAAQEGDEEDNAYLPSNKEDDEPQQEQNETLLLLRLVGSKYVT